MYKIYTNKRGMPHRRIYRFLFIMRITTIILIASLMQVSARGIAQRITLNEHGSSMEHVLREIRRQSGYDFYYDRKIVAETSKIDIAVNNVSLEEAMTNVLRGLPLNFNIKGKIIVIKERKPSFLDKLADVFAVIDVYGRVLDDQGNFLSGATIRVKGADITVTTNAQGFFELNGIKENSILVISYLGFKVKEVAVVAGTPMSIQMEVLSSDLATVNIVNTGYQTISKERSAGSYSKPDMSVFKNRTGSMNVLQRLDGLIPGLTVNNSPAATKNPLLVRGLNSINGTRAPLIVVDGMAMETATVNNINPNDVEDITVLKDATAASIWGSRASNGVIVITTKKGGAGQKLKIDYDGFINFQGKPDLDYFPVLSSSQFIAAARSVFNADLFPYEEVSNPILGDGITALPPHETILYNQSRGLIIAAQADAQLAGLAATNNRSQIKDLWYRNATLMNHTLSMSGGSGNYGIYGSMAYTKNVDNTPGNVNNGFKINVRQDITFNKRIKMYLITDLTNTLSSGKNSFNPDQNFLPYVLFKDTDNKPLGMPWLYIPDPQREYYEAQSKISLDYVPLDEVNYGSTKTNDFLARLSSGIDVKLVDGLSFQGLYGFIKGTRKNVSDLDQQEYDTRSELVSLTVAAAIPGGLPTYYLPTTGSTHTLQQTNQQNYTLRNQLTYDKSWNERKHQLTVLAGQEVQDQLNNITTTSLYGYNKKLLTAAYVDYATLSLGAGLPNPVMPNNFDVSFLYRNPYRETETEQRFVSYFANAGYTFDQKYTLNGSWRVDKSNLFGKDKSAQSKPVYSIGAAWLMSSEKFLEQATWVQRLSLRGTYGITGSSPIPGSAASYDIGAPAGGSAFAASQSLGITIPANPKLTWETTKTYNAGIDFTIFNSRLSGSIDLYKKNTENLIGVLPVNSLSGYTSITGNYGNMQNKGVELSLTSVNLLQKDFSWRTLFTMGYNKNEITKLNRTTPVADGNAKVKENYLEGFPAFAVFAYEYAGLDNVGDPQIRLADGTITKARNASKTTDIKYMGTFQPVWSGGFSNLFSYKNFGLDVNMIYNLGNVMRRDVNTFYAGRMVANVHAEFEDRWKTPGDESRTNIPSYIVNESTSASQRNLLYYTDADINVVSASYIKMRDLTLSYSLPKAVLRAVKAGNITFRAQLSNIMIWKANKYDIDPEFQQSAGTTVDGLLAGSRTLPLNQHVITIGAHATF